jgi:hypothetical protein
VHVVVKSLRLRLAHTTSAAAACTGNAGIADRSLGDRKRPWPEKQRGARLSFAQKWGLGAADTYAQVPTELLKLCVDLDLPAAEALVLVALAHEWRGDAGATFTCSLAKLATILPMTREYVRQRLDALNDRGLIGVFAEPGKVTTIDMTPLLIHLRKHPLTVKPGGQMSTAKLSSGVGELSSGVDSTVKPGRGTVNSVGSRVDPQIQSKDSEAERGVSSSAGSPASPPLAADGNGPENGHGEAPHEAAFRAVTNGHPAPPKMTTAEKTAFAAEQRNKVAAMLAAENHPKEA